MYLSLCGGKSHTSVYTTKVEMINRFGKVKVSENKVIKSIENMKFDVAESFLHTFGAAGENFDLRIVTNS